MNQQNVFVQSLGIWLYVYFTSTYYSHMHVARKLTKNDSYTTNIGLYVAIAR